MRLKALFLGGCVSAALVAFTVPAMPAGVSECASESYSAASNTRNTRAEADSIFEDVQFDAQEALGHADHLQTFARNNLTWQTQVSELDAIKNEVNDIEGKICRLETIRRETAPWQKAEIDRIASTARLLIDNTKNAIVFCNDHQHDLWLAAYQKYTNNLYYEARNLERSVGKAVEYANVSKEYRNLRHSLRMPAAS